jgi:hypothetical protein
MRRYKGDNLILFPYANNVEYNNGELGFTIQFFDNDKTVEIAIQMGLDMELSEKIEELLEVV